MKERFANMPFRPARFPVFYGWPVLAVGSLGLLMSLPGQTMGVSVFTDSLLEALGLTRGQLSAAYMFGTLGSACLLPWAGRLCDRIRYRGRPRSSRTRPSWSVPPFVRSRSRSRTTR